MRARKLRLEDAAPHRILPDKTVFALCVCRRTYITHGPTGSLCLPPPVTLTSVRTKFHAGVWAARRSSPRSCVGQLASSPLGSFGVRLGVRL